MHSLSPAPPTARQIDDALAVVHSPRLVHDQPALRADAWEKLKRQRGQSVNLERISALQDQMHRAHLSVVVDVACRSAAQAITGRNRVLHDLHTHRTPEAPFWDDVDPSAFDHDHGPTLGGAA